MKNLTLSLLILLFTLSCSNSKQVTKKVVVDYPKPEGYYDNDSCDHEPDHSSKKLVKVNVKPNIVKRSASRKISSVSDLLEMAGNRGCSDLTKQEIRDLYEAADVLGGSLEDPRDYSNDPEGYQRYINNVGVIEKFSASEMISPHRPNHAKACGYGNLLPAQCRWMSGAVQGLAASKMREVINNGDPYGPKAITLRNWYRPQCYNEKVNGADGSDHKQARGFDLDFPTARDRAKAQKWLCDLYKRKKPFNMQVGLGCITIHIGLGSPKDMKWRFGPDGSRFWTYKSMRGCPIKRIEGDDCWVEKGNQRRIHTDTGGYRGAL